MCINKVCKKNSFIYNTIIEHDATIMTPISKEFSPEANGKYGLFICNKHVTQINILFNQQKISCFHDHIT